MDGVPVVFQYGQPIPSFDVRADVPPERDYLDLDGRWRFAFDPGDAGTAEGWMQPGFDDSGWAEVEVPLPWDLYGTDGFGAYDGRGYGSGTAFQDGYAWYRTGFEGPAAWSGRFVKLCFLGVNYAASVYVDGTLAGEHEGGHTPFAVDITPMIRPGAVNQLAVRVYRRPWYGPGLTKDDAISGPTELPPKPVDYWPYAGLTRSVFIEATAPVTVSKLVTSARDGRLAAAAVVFNHGTEPVRRRLILDPGAGTGGAPVGQELSLAPDEVRVVRAELPIPAASPWSPADPRLYQLTARLEADGAAGDSLVARYGMRAMEVVGSRLYLNGEPVFLKGLNWHEETPERGRSMTRADYDRLLEVAADLGANFLRNCGYTRHPDFYRAADERGMLVCDETDNFWVEAGQQQLQARYGLSAALVAAMVWNQVNHACVVLWSLQNESATGDRDTYRTWIAQLRDAARIDPQRRPVTWASSTSWDPAFDLADVIGFNEYFGYFYGRDDDLGRTIDTVHRQYPRSPILITENGSYADLGRHGRRSETGTEEWQADKLRRHWRQVAARPGYVAGYTYWVLADYKQRMHYNHNLNGISAMGLLTFDGHRRAAYDTFRDSVNPVRRR
ncbi:MAG: beta-galactosidase [Actinobacteria bacterium]|nr:beta-galactosidase [Actinomycetota bacterium]